MDTNYSITFVYTSHWCIPIILWYTIIAMVPCPKTNVGQALITKVSTTTTATWPVSKPWICWIFPNKTPIETGDVKNIWTFASWFMIIWDRIYWILYNIYIYIYEYIIKYYEQRSNNLIYLPSFQKVGNLAMFAGWSSIHQSGWWLMWMTKNHKKTMQFDHGTYGCDWKLGMLPQWQFW